jgi:DNA-binding transcriptional ArsR family regulator
LQKPESFMGLSKNHLYSEEQNKWALIFKTLGHGARLAILQYLLDHGRANNKELVEWLGLTQSSVSEHLKQLISIEMIIATPVETLMIYSINASKMGELKEIARLFGNGNCIFCD